MLHNKSLQTFHLIAVSLFDPTRSRIVGEVADPIWIAAFRRADFGTQQPSEITISTPFRESEFLGGGYSIEVAAKIENANRARCEAVPIRADGETKWFDALHIVKLFPLVEGKFVPGHYRLESARHSHATIFNLSELSAVLFGYTYLFAHEYKLRCTPERIELVLLTNERTLAVAIRETKLSDALSCESRSNEQTSARRRKSSK